jgi:hypothetical protein
MYLKHVWYYSSVSTWTYLISGEYRFAGLDFTVKASYGKFLYQDTGWRFDATRQFGETDIGFYTVVTEAGRNGGFSVSIPIFPSKRLYPGRIRINPAPYFPWAYRYTSLPEAGIVYETRNNVDGFLKNLFPDFVKGQVTKAAVKN